MPYTFRCDDLTEQEREDLNEVPGVQAYGSRITAPRNAGWIVGQMVPRAQLVEQPRVEAPPGSVLEAAAPWIQPWALDPQYLYDFQARCAQFAYAAGSALVGAPPGAGKTLIALIWLVAASQQRRRSLVITRSSAMLQWSRQIAKYARGVEVLIAQPPSRRKKDAPGTREWLERPQDGSTFRVVITGWGDLRDRVQDGDIPVLAFDSVVFDEAHLAKDARRESWSVTVQGGRENWKGTALATRSAAAASIAEGIRRRLATTATSVANAVEDLWGQLTLVEPAAWGRTATRFLMRYCAAKPGPYGGLVTDGVSRLHLPELSARMSFASVLISYAESHAQLPPKRREIRVIPESEQRKEIKGDEREFKRALKAGDAQRAAEIRHGRTASTKRGAVVDLMREITDDAAPEDPQRSHGKALIFDGRKANVAALYDLLHPKWQTWAVTGDTPSAEVQAAVDAYMAHPGPCALVATWHKLGTSIDLQDSDAVIYSMLPYTPAEVEQSEGRADRLGMKRPLVYYYLLAENSTDQIVAEALLAKFEQVEQVTPGTRGSAFGGIRSALRQDDKAEEHKADLARRMLAFDGVDDE